MWTLLGAINGSVLFVIVLGALLLLWAILTGSPQHSTAYNPMMEGESMRTRPHPCMVQGCRGMRAERHLVCPACWRRVPKALRSDFYRTWDQFQTGHPGGYLRWLAARQRCLESLQ